MVDVLFSLFYGPNQAFSAKRSQFILIEKRGYLPQILWQDGNKKHDYSIVVLLKRKENLAKLFRIEQRSNWSLKILQFNFRIGSMQYAWWQSSGKMAITCELMGRWHDNTLCCNSSFPPPLCSWLCSTSIVFGMCFEKETKFQFSNCSLSWLKSSFHVFTLGITTWNATIIASFSEW